MVLHSLICVRLCNLAERVVPGQVSLNEQNLVPVSSAQDLNISFMLWSRTSRFIILSMMTSNSVGSTVSQLRVHPTIGLNRAASADANAFTACNAVVFCGFLIGQGN